MGSPQERQGPLTEKRVEISLGNGAIRIPFHFGRQPVTSDVMQARLDSLAIVGFKAANPRTRSLDDEIMEELSDIAAEPLARASFIVLGAVLSENGFVNRYESPFISLGDPQIREVFRVITDPLVKVPYYDPAQITRAALNLQAIDLPDTEKQKWYSGELVSHITIPLAERGRVFHSNDEHTVRIEARFRWPADLAEMLGIAYLLGEGKIEDHQLKSRVVERMRENLTSITDLARLSEEDQVHIAAQANELAGSKVVG